MAREVKIKILGDATGFNRAAGNMGKAFIGLVGGATAVAGALYKVGEEFDRAYDTIRVGTGATGDALESLKDDFRAIAADVPANFADIGTAVADLNTRLGLTGPELQEMSKQLLNLSRITETDLGTNIETVTRLFGDWGVATNDQADALDRMFRASQATGPTVDRLARLMVQFGSPMRQLGFTFDQSAALLGKFEKEGVNTELVMGSLRQALGRMARSGEPAIETFQRVTESIKNAGSVSEANALALELFGARAGPDLASAIREGRFEVDELMNAIANGTDTINGAALDTEDFAEKWQRFRNKLMLVVEPAATWVFDQLATGIDMLIEKWPEFSARFNAFKEDFLRGLEVLKPGWDGLVARFRDGWSDFERGAVIVNQSWDEFYARFSSGAAKVRDFVIPIFQAFGDLWKRGIYPVLQGVWWFLSNAVIPAFMFLGQVGIGAFSAVAGMISWVIDLVSTLMSSLDRVVGLVERVKNAAGGLSGATSKLNAVTRFIPGFPSIPFFDSGGVMPGPTGVHSLAMVAGGETILPTHKGGGSVGNTYNITVQALHTRDAERAVIDAINEYERRNGRRVA